MKKGLLLFSLVAFAALFLPSCTDNVTSIGLNLIDEVGTDFTDTVTLTAYSIREDSLNTSALTANLVGEVEDPVFGPLKAATYTQFALAGASVNFGSSPTLDSVVLTLQLSSYYGDTTSKVGIRVYELTEDLSPDRYYQYSTVAYDETAPLNYSLTGYSIKPNTKVTVDTGIYNAHLRIRLSDEFGRFLLSKQSEMTSTAAFQNIVKGLCIASVSHTGSVGYVLHSSLTSSLTGITLYYHNNGTASKYTFPCDKSCARFTGYTHNYESSTNADFVQEILNGDRTVGAKTLFAQASGGIKTAIRFPHIKDSFTSLNNRIVVNKAELVVCNVDPDEKYLVQPSGLSLQGINTATGKTAYLPDDEYYSSTNYFGGTYDSDKKEYRFRITKYVQDLILGNTEYADSIYLVVKGAGVRANRLVIGGTGRTDDRRLRLELSYTTY